MTSTTSPTDRSGAPISRGSDRASGGASTPHGLAERSGTARTAGATAFVLGGGGVHGAVQVGMLRALLERDIRPGLVVGTSVGALNGALVAADLHTAVPILTRLWENLGVTGPFDASLLERATTFARSRTHLHSNTRLRRLLLKYLPVRNFSELQVPFTCVAASIERAAAHWFSDGPLVDALLATTAVPGLLPAAEIDGEHFLDGGLVDSIPVDRAIELGAKRIFVLQVGRVEQPLVPPRWPWEVGLVAFEIARRHRFIDTMVQLPQDVEVHVLPSGVDDLAYNDASNLRYRDTSKAAERIEGAYEQALAYLDGRIRGPWEAFADSVRDHPEGLAGPPDSVTAEPQ